MAASSRIPAPAARPGRTLDGRWLAVLAGVAVVAALARLVPLLRGGGLFGLGNYDDAVYYASAVGLAHGRLPYRDFLLLHPPGIVVALTPFALAGRVLAEHTGFALARLAWVLLGCLSSVLVARILRPAGLAGALLGGLAYALMFSSVYVEWTTQLQGLANACLLLALTLLVGRPAAERLPVRVLLLAGALLGAAASVKIWNVASLVLLAGWALVALGRRAAGWLVAGAGLGATVICLPFFLAAPRAMWTDVVAAQLGRARGATPVSQRLADIAGLHLYLGSGLLLPLLAVCLVALLAVLVLAGRERAGRPAVVLTVGLSAVLLASPSWFSHYSSLVAPPLAVAFGAAAQQVVGRLPGRRLAALAVTGVVAVLLVGAVPLARHTVGRSFPGGALAAAVRPLPGCVLADDPAALIEMDMLGRNLSRGCRLVVDMSGYSYAPPRPPGQQVTRSRDRVWQHFAVDYLSSGSAVLLTKYTARNGLSRSTAALVRSWPVLKRSGRYVVRTPVPPGR